MKKWLKKGALLLLLLVCSLAALQAQDKYGHLNSGNLLVMMPEAQAADKELETYRDQLVNDLKKKEEKLQAEALKLQEDYAAGVLSKVKATEKQTALQKKGEELMKENYGINEKVAKKREELLKPIVEKVDVAIKAVGKEGNYKMIFDSSIFNALLYVQDSDDVMPLVKAKLGLK